MRGRKPYPAHPGTRISLGLKVTPDVKTKLDDMASNNGRTQSQEAEVRLERSFEEADALDRALAMSYGDDNAGLIHLFGHVLGATAPTGGGWLDDDGSAAAVTRALYHLLKRLRSPDDGHIVEDDSPEGRIDRLIYDRLGYVIEPPNVSARARWAAEQRKRLGKEIAERLLRIRRAMHAALEAGPVREMPKPDQAVRDSWDRVIAGINARRERRSEGSEGA